MALLSRQELAKEWRMSVRSIDRLRKRGLPFIQLGRGRVLFDLDQATTWLRQFEQRRITTYPVPHSSNPRSRSWGENSILRRLRPGLFLGKEGDHE